jgi:hypothetical protein
MAFYPFVSVIFIFEASLFPVLFLILGICIFRGLNLDGNNFAPLKWGYLFVVSGIIGITGAIMIVIHGVQYIGVYFLLASFGIVFVPISWLLLGAPLVRKIKRSISGEEKISFKPVYIFMGEHPKLMVGMALVALFSASYGYFVMLRQNDLALALGIPMGIIILFLYVIFLYAR